MISLRRSIQWAATALSNSWWGFMGARSIYGGPLKAVCVPGLNCHSCPAAAGACPVGVLQSLLAGLRPALEAGRLHMGLYVVGMLGISGSLAGRMPCGWLCPFGLFQELLYRIPSPKFRLPAALGWGKYLFLAVFVLLIPLLAVDDFGYGVIGFCKYVCPAGTLEAGIPLMILQPELRGLMGALFFSKLAILAAVTGAAVTTRRPFCRAMCPLGAVYALFNRHSLFRLVHHPDRCTRCKACFQNCPMGVRFYESANNTDCIRCLRCLRTSCRFGAIGWEFGGEAHSAGAAPPSAAPPGR